MGITAEALRHREKGFLCWSLPKGKVSTRDALAISFWNSLRLCVSAVNIPQKKDEEE
jgi:hypothetical protein